MNMTKSTKTTLKNVLGRLEKGHVWVAPIWSVVEQRHVYRPAVIVASSSSYDGLDVLCCWITRTPARNEFDIEITEEQRKEIGLHSISTIRASKITPVPISLLDMSEVEVKGAWKRAGFIGELPSELLEQVLLKCHESIG